ncbi:MAG: RNA polymerase factor sigma-70 [Lachnospiraceae bacterium]|nr:RNA polymerase factor sigma-70 [Lachnospiraceae bacterium]
MKNQDTRTDEELVQCSRGGDTEATDVLVGKYKNLVRRKANAFFLIGGDTDDLIQEGMIGLFKAVRDYDGTRESSFLNFATICIERQLRTAIERNNRKKHQPLNNYVSIDQENDSEPLEETLKSLQAVSPEELVIRAEDLQEIRRRASEDLSPMEKAVLSMHLSGLSYVEIAEALGKNQKSVDNALQRIRKKLAPTG